MPVLARNLAATPFLYFPTRLCLSTALGSPAGIRGQPSAASPLLQGWASTPGAWPGQPLSRASARPSVAVTTWASPGATPIERAPNAGPRLHCGQLDLLPASFPSVLAGTRYTSDGSRPASRRGHAAPEGWAGSGPAARCPQTGATVSPDTSMSQLRLACNRGASCTSLGLPKPDLWPAWEGSRG